MTKQIEKYYMDFDEGKNYDRVLFRDGQNLQGRELNNIQEQGSSHITGIAAALFKDGDILSKEHVDSQVDGQVLINKETGEVNAHSGRIYLKGAVRLVPSASFSIPIEGTVNIGVYLEENIISELDDPSLYNPVVGSRAQGKEGAWRLQVMPTWGFEGDAKKGEFFPVHVVENAIVQEKEPLNHLALTQAEVSGAKNRGQIGESFLAGETSINLDDFIHNYTGRVSDSSPNYPQGLASGNIFVTSSSLSTSPDETVSQNVISQTVVDDNAIYAHRNKFADMAWTSWKVINDEAAFMRHLVGKPVAVMSSTLPEDHMWLTGGLASFINYPEFAADYLAGEFEGMVTDIYAETTVHTFVKHLNASGLVDGLYMPNSSGLFSRSWGDGQIYDVDRVSGSYQGDAIRNIVGNIGAIQGEDNNQGLVCSGAFTYAVINRASAEGTGELNFQLYFDASGVVPTADENRPKNYTQPTAIYLGRHV